MPPGLGSIEPAGPSGELPQAQSMTRQELEKGLDLIQDLLDEQMSDAEKRVRAAEAAVEASVPWLPEESRRQKRNDRPRHMNRFSIGRWCDCSDGSSCSPDRVNSGF